MAAVIVWKFKELLEREGVTAYRLQTALGGKVGPQTVYRWARKAPDKLDLGVLRVVLEELSRLIGRSVRLEEVLELDYSHE
jgi:hypothetical protein